MEGENAAARVLPSFFRRWKQFHFPTYAEAYRVAALDIIDQTAKHRTDAEAA